MALPVALIVITGEIDLSIAAILGLTGVVMAELFTHGWSIWLGDGRRARGRRGLAGPSTASSSPGLGLPSLAVTIGTLTLFRGIAQMILPTDTIGGFPAPLTNIGVVPIPGTQIPWSILFFAMLALVIGVVLHATPLGRSIFAIGAGQEAAFFAGIRVKRIKFLALRRSRACSAASPGSSGRSASPRRATTRAPGRSCSSSRSCCSAASRSSAGAARSSASCSPSRSSAPADGDDARPRHRRRTRTSSSAGS